MVKSVAGYRLLCNDKLFELYFKNKTGDQLIARFYFS